MTFYPLTHIEIKLHVIFALTSKKAEILQFLAKALFILLFADPLPMWAAGCHMVALNFQEVTWKII